MPDDFARIRDANKEYEAAVNSGDPTRWAAVLTDDVVVLAPDHSPARGKSAAVDWGRRTFFDRFMLRYSASLHEIETLGHTAFAQGSFSLGLTPKSGGSPAQRTGNLLVILRQSADGAWRFARLCFNFVS